jgi:protein TonB
VLKKIQTYYSNLDEIIFEYRNKLYGAYELRKNYNRRLLIALIPILFLAIILPTGLLIYYKSTIDPEEKINLEKYEGFDLRMDENDIPDDLPKTKEEEVKDKIEETEKPDETTTDEPKKEEVKQPDPTNPNLELTPAQQAAKLDSIQKADATAKALKDSLDAAAQKLAKQGTDTTKKGSGTSMMVNRKGGMKEFMAYIQQNFRYQKPPIEYDCTINLKILINEDGSLSDIEVVKGVRTDYNQEVLRVAKEYKGWFNDELKTNSGIKIRKLVPVIIHAPPPASF